MLHELDPHSSYLSKEELEELNEQLEGEFEGIGVSFNVLEDTIYIIRAISGGPSERVGIMAGDRIVKVEGETVAGTGITTPGCSATAERTQRNHGGCFCQTQGMNPICWNSPLPGIKFLFTAWMLPIWSMTGSDM